MFLVLWLHYSFKSELNDSFKLIFIQKVLHVWFLSESLDPKLCVKLTSSSMDTLLLGSASALRLMLTVASAAVAVAAVASESIRSFLVE